MRRERVALDLSLLAECAPPPEVDGHRALAVAVIASALRAAERGEADGVAFVCQLPADPHGLRAWSEVAGLDGEAIARACRRRFNIG